MDELENNKTVSMDVEMEVYEDNEDGSKTVSMDVEMEAYEDNEDGSKIENGPAIPSVVVTSDTYETLTDESSVASEEDKENVKPQLTNKKRKRSESEYDREARRPHTQFFPRPDKDPLEVSWDVDCSLDEIPSHPATREMIRRIVAQVALERGHEVAWIIKCHVPNRWCESNIHGDIDDRYLQYAEHIDAEFGYESDEEILALPGTLLHETATIYIGPAGECLDGMTLWRESGGPAVVWGQIENL